MKKILNVLPVFNQICSATRSILSAFGLQVTRYNALLFIFVDWNSKNSPKICHKDTKYVDKLSSRPASNFTKWPLKVRTGTLLNRINVSV